MEAMIFNGNQRTVVFACSDQGLCSANSCSDCVASNLPAKTDRATNLTDKWNLCPWHKIYQKGMCRSAIKAINCQQFLGPSSSLDTIYRPTVWRSFVGEDMLSISLVFLSCLTLALAWFLSFITNSSNE